MTDAELNGGRKPAALQQVYYHDLLMQAHYRGAWKQAQTAIGRIERRLRDRLHLRRKQNEGHE
jgi:hypothetical protein